MRTCPHCGREIAATATFCVYCGERVSTGTSIENLPSAGGSAETTIGTVRRSPSETRTTDAEIPPKEADDGPASVVSPEPAPAPAPPAGAGYDLRPPSGGDRLVAATVVQRPRQPSFEYLVEVDGANAGATHLLQGERTVIGRDPRSQVIVNDSKVSAFHAHVQRDRDGDFTIADDDSTNGTFVNDELVRGSRPLVHDDIVRVGDTLLQFMKVVPPAARR
jgi:hypothetical protein